MNIGLWVLIIIVAALVLWIIGMFNRFIVLRNRMDNSLSQIDVQLKRRNDLIPNLVETVKGYAKHEKTTFQMVTEARTAIMGAKSMKEKAKANDQLTGALKTLFAVAENYPQLKANENFKALQEELAGTENKIAYSRQFYNDSVMSFNQATQMFPGSVIAGMFTFKQREFFKAGEAEKTPVKVSF